MSAAMKLHRFATDAGALRMGLFAITLTTFIFAPRPGTTPTDHGLGMVSTLFVPIVVPVLFITLLLDAFMSRLLMLEHESGGERARLRRLVWVDLAVALAVFVFWIPYFRAVS